MLLRHYLEQGTSKSELARQFGVSRDTIHRWIRDGELDGTVVQSEPSLGGQQIGFGVFASIVNPTATIPLLKAQLSMPLDEEIYTFHSGRGSASQQNSPQAPPGRTFDQDQTAIVLMKYLLVAPGPVDAFGMPFEQAGHICKEPNGQNYYYHLLGVGTAITAPAAVLAPERCSNGTTAGYAHTHPGHFLNWEYPSGFRSQAEYLDVDMNPANGNSRSDLWIADDYFDSPNDPTKPYIGPNGPNVMFYVTSPKSADGQTFVKYKKTANGPAKDNIFQFNYSTNLWAKVNPAW